MQKIVGEIGVVIIGGEDQCGMVWIVVGGGNKVDLFVDLWLGCYIDGFQLVGFNYWQQVVKLQCLVVFVVFYL